MINWKKYIVVFVITSLIFITAFSASNYLNDKKMAELKNIEDKIAIDILSLETQFDLLEGASCRKIDSTILSQELDTLASKLSFAEEHEINAEEVVRLKKHYTLLEIKDYMLTKRFSEKCGIEPAVILYFYSNKGECEACKKQGFVLTFLREEHPELRVYSFDYDLDLNTLKTLISISNIKETLPALMINDKVYYGFRSVEDIRAILPSLSKKATSTPEKR